MPVRITPQLVLGYRNSKQVSPSYSFGLKISLLPHADWRQQMPSGDLFKFSRPASDVQRLQGNYILDSAYWGGVVHAEGKDEGALWIDCDSNQYALNEQIVSYRSICQQKGSTKRKRVSRGGGCWASFGHRKSKQQQTSNELLLSAILIVYYYYLMDLMKAMFGIEYEMCILVKYVHWYASSC